MSIYSPAKLGEADNQIALNDYTVDPVYRTTARSASKWQIRQQDLPVPFESGSNDFLTLLGDSAYIITGQMYPSDENSYDSGLNALRTVASLDIEEADPASLDGYVPYTWGDASGNFSKQIFLKPLYVQIAETTTQGFVQPFTIYCKVIDPTIYGGALQTASTAQSNPTLTTGSAEYPFTYPVVYGATLFTVSAVAQNIGTEPTYPTTVTVFGPVTNPVITNEATGEYIEVDVTLGGGDQLNITYNATQLDINLNGTSVLSSLAGGSTLFKIQPGFNTIQLSGQSVGTGAYAEVFYYSGYPLA